MPEATNERTDTSSAFRLLPHWRVAGGRAVCGLSNVREGNYLFGWDDDNTLFLLDARGTLQSRIRIQGQVVAAVAADSGACYAAATREGELIILNSDLSIRRQSYFRPGIASLALDSHGEYLLFSDRDGFVGMADIDGNLRWFEKASCPLAYLSFMPILPFAVAGSRLGLCVCYDFSGACRWKTGPVCHVGGLAVRGADGLCVLACYSEGLQLLSYSGKDLARRRLGEHCRLLAVPFASRLVLTSGFSNRLSLVDEKGTLLAQARVESPPTHLAISAAADQAFAALHGGEIVSFEVRKGEIGPR